jgi:hypothetical protein
LSGFTIQCDFCNKISWAENIVDLIGNHLDAGHMLKCSHCSASGAYIYAVSKTQEGGEWERWAKGVIRIDYTDQDNKNYHPYVYLHSHEGPKGKIDSVQISYYKDLRQTGGSLKHGHGPGGTPVLGLSDLKNIIGKLDKLGIL